MKCCKSIVLPGLLAGLLMLIAGLGVSFIWGAIFPAIAMEYQNMNIFRAWNDPLMSLFFLYPFVFGLALSWAWDRVKKAFKGSPKERGWQFTLTMFAIATIPGMLISYASFQISGGITLSWLVGGFINLWIAGQVFAKMNA